MTTDSDYYPFGKLQFVWWPLWVRESEDIATGGRLLPRFGNIGPYPSDGPNIGRIYRWRFMIGPLEIRRWAPYRTAKT